MRGRSFGYSNNKYEEVTLIIAMHIFVTSAAALGGMLFFYFYYLHASGSTLYESEDQQKEYEAWLNQYGQRFQMRSIIGILGFAFVLIYVLHDKI